MFPKEVLTEFDEVRTEFDEVPTEFDEVPTKIDGVRDRINELPTVFNEVPARIDEVQGVMLPAGSAHRRALNIGLPVQSTIGDPFKGRIGEIDQIVNKWIWALYGS